MAAPTTNENTEFAFSKKNYLFMGIGILMLIIGFALLAGGGSTNPNEFSPEIFNTQRLVVAPLFMLGGFVIEIYAIMYRKKDNA
jgi:membrane-bound ClpP family serine protease